MAEDFEDALRPCVEEAVDREVEQLRDLLELRLTVVIREVLAGRLPTCRRPGTASPDRDLPDHSVGRALACRDENNNHIGGA